MQCPNCGARLDDTIPKCPYCSTMNFPGSEKEYKAELNEIHEDLEDLKKVPIDTLKHTSVKAGRRMGILAIILLLLILSGIGIYQVQKKMAADADARRLAWEYTTFKKLDVWYEQEDYKAILNFIYTDEEAQNYSIYRWKHSDFFWAHLDYDLICNREKNEQEDIMMAFNGLLLHTYLNNMTEKDLARVLVYQKEAEEILNNDYYMTLEDLQKYFDEEVKK